MRVLVSAAEKQNEFLATLNEVNPITGAVVDAEFADALSDRSCVSGITKRQPINSLHDFRTGPDVP